MADNVAVTAGAGTTIAADEVVDATLGTVKVQYVKLMDGTLDGTGKAAVGTNGLKVDGSAVTQPISGTVTVQQATASSLNANVSGTVTANIGTAGTLATSAKQPALGTAGTASADVITVQGIASMTALKVDGSAVTQPVSGTITANIGTAGTLALDATLTGGTQKAKLVDTGGSTAATVKAASSGGALATDTALVVTVRDANANGQAAMANSAPVVIASDQSSVKVVAQTSTTGGATPQHYLSAATTNATSLKASAGTLYGFTAINTTATVYYLKFFNKASAPTLGTDTPVLTYPVPASTSGAGLHVHYPIGIAFGTGIAWALTGAAADADATAAATGVTIDMVYA